ncbi:MAG: M20/M25/M40 family metallo-hydrolase, partial [Rhizomicrobium sp.]
MESKSADAIARVISLALVALAIWLIGSAFNGQPRPLGLDAPATEFSAARANKTLKRLLGPEIPHPVSTTANQAVRDRIRAEFAALGVETSIYRGIGCEGRAKYGFFACGTAEDILAEVAPGEGKAIILMAHYDSVPAGPGASDDQSGVATVLETVRALKARGVKTVHPVLALITDGEEAGLLGAAAFLDNPALKARAGVVVNVEARGNQGPSMLFQTSPGDGPLIDLYARNVPEYATGSLFAVVYRLLPNDTDLTLFIDRGFTAFNFGFIGRIAHYHTALDRRANLSQSTLQMHGDNLLGVASGLMQTDFASLKGGDDVYLTLLGQFLPRLPASWALPLAVLTFAFLLLAAFLSRGEGLGIGRKLAAIAAPLSVIVGSAAFGWILFELAALISEQDDPSYAHPIFLRIALGLGVAAMTILVSRLANARMAALSVWMWMSGLGVVTAALLPGLSPYFLFPALIGSVLILAQSRIAGAWNGTAGVAAMTLAALLPLLIWFSLSATAESVQGLALHPL